jgi:hypothetical protein
LIEESVMGKFMVKVAEALAIIGIVPHKGQEKDAAGKEEALPFVISRDGFAYYDSTGRLTFAPRPGKEADAVTYEEFDPHRYMSMLSLSDPFWTSVNERFPMSMNIADVAIALKPELYAMELAWLAEIFPDDSGSNDEGGGDRAEPSAAE